MLRTGDRHVAEIIGSRTGRALRIEIIRVLPDNPEIAIIHVAHDMSEERAIRSQLLMNDRLATMGRLAASIRP